MLKLDYITNKSDLELAAILISAQKDRHWGQKPGCSRKALENQNIVLPHLAT